MSEPMIETLIIGCPAVDDEGDFLCSHDVEVSCVIEPGDGIQGPHGRLGKLPIRCDNVDRDYTDHELAMLRHDAKCALIEAMYVKASEQEAERRAAA